MGTLKISVRAGLPAVILISLTLSAIAGGITTKSSNRLLLNYSISSADTVKVYEKADKMPTPVGGQEAFYNYLSKKIVYPATDRESNISGKVWVSVIVEKDGKLTHITAVKGPSSTLKMEAVKAIKTAPKWRPATINGKTVRLKYLIPVNFTISDS